ncbi:hypothetical protein DER46DRAFT_568658 [Fusarium sp. MPI-SDFR-AT-0072]|nr:hypothetical protein DER46DRAFT_568658 [Fusarium sp. MPI-SDFR-AT-0072]
MARKVADIRYSPIRLALESSANITIAFIVCPLGAMLVVGSLIPMSESAAGGNYSLSYLSAPMRRHLTPFPVLDRFPMLGVTGFGFMDSTAYTMYLPGAGFLWSDGMIWLQALPEEMLDSLNDHVDEDEEHWSIEGSHRVFFQDKFLTRYPWEVQKYPRIKTRPQWSRWTSSGDYAFFGMNSSIGHDLTRIQIGTSSDTASGNSTMYRSIPSSEATQSNDTVIRVLDLKLEASCTINASGSSSRLFLIENTAGTTLPKAPKGGKPIIDTGGVFRGGMEYWMAR